MSRGVERQAMCASPRLRGPLAIVLAGLCVLAALGAVAAIDDLVRPPAHEAALTPAPPVREVGAVVSLRSRDGARVAVDLPNGWGVTRRDGDLLFLAAPSRCHTATVKAFPDETRETVDHRARQMLGYVAGGDFDAGRLWSGTVAGGRGFAVYDPKLLLGVEAVHRGARRSIVLVHGMPDADDRCAAASAREVQMELSRLLEGVRVG